MRQINGAIRDLAVAGGLPGVVEGDQVPVHYDPLLAKVIAQGETRTQAIDRLVAALRSFPILGIETNLPFVIAILEDPAFRAGQVDTGFLDRETERLVAGLATSELPAVVQAVFATHQPMAAAASPSTGTTAPDWDPWSAASGHARLRPSGGAA